MDLVNFIKNLFCKHKSNTDKDDLKNVKIDDLTGEIIIDCRQEYWFPEK